MEAFSGFVPLDSNEKKIIEIITNLKIKGTDMPDLIHFYNLLFDPVRHDGFEQYEGFYLATNVLRQELGLKRVGRPGDYDILFIPYNKNHMFYERTAVFEVKVVRPTIKQPSKSANSRGEQQVYGLLEDGFPLVGLLHVVSSEPLLPEQTTTIRVSKLAANIDRKFDDPPLPPMDELFENEPLDWLPWYSVDKQMARLISVGFPKYVAIDAFSIMKSPDGTYTTSVSYEWRGYRSGYFNPKKSEELLECIRKHFEHYGDNRYRKLHMFSAEEK